MRRVLVFALLLVACNGRRTAEPHFVKAASLQFDCRSRNIGVLAEPSSDFSLACDVSAFDAANVPMEGAKIQFLEEAGSILSVDDGFKDRPSFAYFPRQGARPMPKDVAPLPGEPTMELNGVVRNPRDMLATLVAYVEGDNPQFGDMFSGDPFVDMNDNQQRDDDEPFISADGSGVYATSQTKLLWKQIKIVWSGKLSESPLIAKCEAVGGTGSTIDLQRSGKPNPFKLTLLDDYFNVLASNSGEDRINWWVAPAGNVILGNGQDGMADHPSRDTGFALDKDSNFPSTTTAASFRIESSYGVTLQNVVPQGAFGDIPYTLGSSIERALTIDAYGEPAYFITEYLPSCGGLLK